METDHLVDLGLDGGQCKRIEIGPKVGESGLAESGSVASTFGTGEEVRGSIKGHKFLY